MDVTLNGGLFTPVVFDVYVHKYIHLLFGVSLSKRVINRILKIEDFMCYEIRNTELWVKQVFTTLFIDNAGI